VYYKRKGDRQYREASHAACYQDYLEWIDKEVE